MENTVQARNKNTAYYIHCIIFVLFNHRNWLFASIWTNYNNGYESTWCFRWCYLRVDFYRLHLA